ncbi:Type III restriction enzyme, res subunit [Musa troglodytarum]|uniref:Type III restriction enzyme, res subunit n=1 Tax=Musa troglodytarum TaxID=320322 RepID=A0A9E7HPV3_9LILI|nr:Type III restriction enzyme, res subunit [Musa troglodytarum]
MAGGGSASSRPRYAPEDPTLPKPWRALVDGSTGYLYYWNPETNVTQYERPADELPPPPPLLPPPPPLLPPKPASVVPAERRHHHEDDDRYGRSRSHQHGGGKSSGMHDHGHDTKDSREPRATSTRGHASSADGGASASVEAYRRQNEIIVTGDDVPAPFMTFESTGFPAEILKELLCDIRSRVELMSYAVLHCATLVFLGGRAYSLTSLWVGLPPVIWFRLPLRSTRSKALSAPALHLQAAAKVGKGFLSDQLVTGAASSDIVQAAT